MTMAFERLFLLELPFGLCAGVSLPTGDFALPAGLHPDEAAFARALPEARRAGWVGGRVALRAAFDAAKIAVPNAILSTPRGAPLLPPDAVGSVSHKRTVAVALAAPAATPSATVGIDVEEIRPLRTDIAPRVLTPQELADLPTAGPTRDIAVLVSFSAKEAIYKALDPWVQRFVAFDEATVNREPDGTFGARLTLARGEGPFSVEIHQARGADTDGLIVVAARIRRARD
ncbi:MAG TPA: 4'-phosphopantetheinyl transferase superfamily protein [Polyangia bacterium]